MRLLSTISSRRHWTIRATDAAARLRSSRSSATTSEEYTRARASGREPLVVAVAAETIVPQVQLTRSAAVGRLVHRSSSSGRERGSWHASSAGRPRAFVYGTGGPTPGGRRSSRLGRLRRRDAGLYNPSTAPLPEEPNAPRGGRTFGFGAGGAGFVRSRAMGGHGRTRSGSTAVEARSSSGTRTRRARDITFTFGAPGGGFVRRGRLGRHGRDSVGSTRPVGGLLLATLRAGRRRWLHFARRTRRRSRGLERRGIDSFAVRPVTARVPPNTPRSASLRRFVRPAGASRWLELGWELGGVQWSAVSGVSLALGCLPCSDD